jgi:hypothetical protein
MKGCLQAHVQFGACIGQKSNIDVSVAISAAPAAPATTGADTASPKSNKVTLYPGIVRKGGQTEFRPTLSLDH